MQYLVTIGILLIMLGFLALFAGILISAISGTESSRAEVKGAGIIFIGPIPIAFGTDKQSLIVVSILMAFLMIVAYFVFRGGALR